MEVDMVDGIRFEIALDVLSLRLPDKAKDGVCKFCDQPIDRDGMFCLSCLPDIEAIGASEYRKVYALLHRACGFNRFANRPTSRSNVPKPVSIRLPTPVAPCNHCGALFEQRQPTQKCCSKKCTRIAEKRRYRMRRNPNLKPRVLGVCQKCRAACMAYVCDSCQYDLARGRRSKRRKSLKGVESEFYTHNEIAERDGWRCQLCRKMVNKRLKYPHPMCASIDHIVPISKGGTDVRVNVQLAHLVCNMSKGNRTLAEGEQLRLLG
jgi:predicted nucleic acid-binding Zn ribbon protein